MNNIQQYLGSAPVQLFTVLAALIGVLGAFAVQRRNSRSSVLGNFVSILSADIASLNASPDRDAYSILETRFPIQHGAFIQTLQVTSLFDKSKLKRAWKDYHGKDGEQEWWLPNEYSVISSNKLANTPEGTRRLAIHRLNAILRTQI